MKTILNNIKGDKVIWAVVFLLSIFSVLAVYSSTGTLAFRYQSGNTEYYLIKHLGILLLGFVLMYLAHQVKYKYYARISQLAIYVSVPLLAYTLMFGTNVNEASRWYTLPLINLTFQPSDFAKLALIIFVARLLAKKQENIEDFKKGFIAILLPVLLITLLILPANLSTAAMIFITCLVLMFVGRVRLRYILALVGIGLVSMALLIAIVINVPQLGKRVGTWQSRIENFKSGDSDGNYQVEQAKIAIANGGFTGRMPGNSTQKNFLPHPYSDFIFAIIIEEYGLIGGTLVVLLYLVLLFRAIKIVIRSPRNFAAFLTFGVAFSLVFQAMINMMVAVNLMPVTGQTLPLISMGGTSIWFTSISIGIILSVSREVEEEIQKNDKQPKQPEHAVV
ncbi:FtsW/RodA/SpoVE family cell cycle protein [Lentimicrobium sp.]|jgi:cell division protein FtsW|uniref:FtsW/RodA/SpoVE family cell cycle protein n=1 Tax=Lentimicrobium sp. TaxID=2034841 RepID=UPI002BA3EB4C|nr:FtsW/RodA/SpoVE family cell cycle protein [Lentimicrobium sp.]HPF64902.1 FtsW/RodA/SpoVE family cell cycle protein [Lentimicrobium sp.]HPJ61373.1 FtsW/RodA/SpoVE family cell cycle protein [Lentimicrobium sp.]HPR25769.1 FtsW/RodA/SpoVE family cell cycle protein [Lentimicrobium sp.]HRW69830.1 FtsW/RodA/SpoVE family cell cycle protein [Lentimicrobium sp.]